MCAMNLLSLVVSSLLFLQIQAQYGSLQGTNYNIGDQSRQEVIDANGNIQGQYSYVDPNGKTVVVRYTAGPNGFQVANGPAAAPAPQPQPATPIQPGVNYRGLQLSRPKYLGQLFRAAPANAVPAYTQKQFEAYQNSLNDAAQENNQLLDNTPAQFPSNRPQALSLTSVPQTPSRSFQQIQFLQPGVSNNGLNIPLFQSANSVNSGNSIQYAPEAGLFQPDLRQIAQNPTPPQFRAPPPARDATPITEDAENSAILSFDQGNRYFNYNF